MSAIASALLCTVKFVNSFARRQQLFDIVTYRRHFDSIDVERQFEFSVVSCYLVRVTISHKISFYLLVVVNTFHDFHRNPFNILAKRKKN